MRMKRYMILYRRKNGKQNNLERAERWFCLFLCVGIMKYLFRETSEMFGMSRYYNVGGQNIDSVLLRYEEKTMKESIEMKLEEHGKKVIEKDSLSMDDINFLIYLLNRIEMKENAAAAKAEKEASDRVWREKMSNMIDMAVGGK